MPSARKLFAHTNYHARIVEITTLKYTLNLLRLKDIKTIEQQSLEDKRYGFHEIDTSKTLTLMAFYYETLR